MEQDIHKYIRKLSPASRDCFLSSSATAPLLRLWFRSFVAFFLPLLPGSCLKTLFLNGYMDKYFTYGNSEDSKKRPKKWSKRLGVPPVNSLIKREGRKCAEGSGFQTALGEEGRGEALQTLQCVQCSFLFRQILDATPSLGVGKREKKM